jgi:hypothetical protein
MTSVDDVRLHTALFYKDKVLGIQNLNTASAKLGMAPDVAARSHSGPSLSSFTPITEVQTLLSSVQLEPSLMDVHQCSSLKPTLCSFQLLLTWLACHWLTAASWQLSKLHKFHHF